ncbi:unnamed protein product [Protopolystoma xenopodis]|uniref:Uncharacterized protein n=1 Tax=Protopolystoma xenopodis TaxID=117903 RepID=A0A3S5BWM2_9PLAT|nr:unnamed protein product [Protopolystoma xenopodis]
MASASQLSTLGTGLGRQRSPFSGNATLANTGFAQPPTSLRDALKPDLTQSGRRKARRLRRNGSSSSRLSNGDTNRHDNFCSRLRSVCLLLQ